MIGDHTSYTVVNHVVEFSVRGGPWSTWPGVNADVIAGLEEETALEAFTDALKTRHDPETGIRFRLVHREAIITDLVVAEELPDGRVAVPKDHGKGPGRQDQAPAGQ
jgi:hypothetical protein